MWLLSLSYITLTLCLVLTYKAAGYYWSQPPHGQYARAVKKPANAPVRAHGWSSSHLPPSGDNVYDVVVVGGGPAGLAVGATLKNANVSYLIVEKRDVAGAKWTDHYARLCLHTLRDVSHLPYLPFPTSWPQFVPREDLARYLELYPALMALNIRYNTSVGAVLPDSLTSDAKDDGGRYSVAIEGSGEVLRARHVVMATGDNATPNVPRFAGMDSFAGRILHSSEYQSGEEFRGQNVLVVGFGNSGSEIALDLWERGASVSAIIRSPLNVLSRDRTILLRPLFGLVRWLFFDRVELLDKIAPPARPRVLPSPASRGEVNVTVPHPEIGVFEALRRRHTPPNIDIGQWELIENGEIPVFKALHRFSPSSVSVSPSGNPEDSHELPVDAVVLATGYQKSLTSLLPQTVMDAVTDEHHGIGCSGRESPIPGLWFIGYDDFLGRLFQIRLEAHAIADAIARTTLPPNPILPSHVAT